MRSHYLTRVLTVHHIYHFQYVVLLEHSEESAVVSGAHCEGERWELDASHYLVQLEITKEEVWRFREETEVDRQVWIREQTCHMVLSLYLIRY